MLDVGSLSSKTLKLAGRISLTKFHLVVVPWGLEPFLLNVLGNALLSCVFSLVSKLLS